MVIYTVLAVALILVLRRWIRRSRQNRNFEIESTQDTAPVDNVENVQIDSRIFQNNLLLTQLYCENQIKRGNDAITKIFRSINPIVNGKNIITYTSYNVKAGEELTLAEWTIPYTGSPTFLREQFDRQMAVKAALIRSGKQDSSFAGSIVIAKGEATNGNAAAIASDGFVDNAGFPPMDTWFYFTQNAKAKIIFAWIPDTYTGLIGSAIDENVSGSLSWFKDETFQYSK